MPLLFVAHPSADVYGSDLQLIEFVLAAREDAWEVTVTVPGPGPLVARLEEAGAQVIVDARTPVLRKSALTPVGLVRLAGAMLRSIVTGSALLRRLRPTVVAVNTVTIPSWLVAARLTRTPALCYVHEAEDGVSRILRRGLAAPLRLARTILVNSQSSAGVLTDVDSGLGRRLTIVHNGVPDAGAPAPLRSRRPGDPAHLTLVARLSPRKGVDVALDAVGILRAAGRDVTLDVCGTPFAGYEPFEAELRARAAQPDLAGAVHLRGYVSPTRPALDAADIVLVPSRQEPFGNTAVEALLAGRPLVASATQGLTEIVTPGVTGLQARPGDPADLARAIAELLDDPARAARLAAAGRDEAVDRFGIARYRAAARAVLNATADRPVSERHHGVVAPTVTVAILTYRRNDEVRRTLAHVAEHVRGLAAADDAHRDASTGLAARTRVLVVDNDPRGGARDTVERAALALRESGGPDVRYVHEPRSGIGAARARALDEATTDLLAFIDDDDAPGEVWLAPLVDTWATHRATLVAGTIVPEWPEPPDAWTQAGGFFRRPVYDTGAARRSAPTGNLLIDVTAVRALGVGFRADRGLRGGEDTLFTREVVAAGGVLVACAQSIVVDRIPHERTSRAWLLQRVQDHAATAVDVDLTLARGRLARARVRAAAGARGAIVTARGAWRLGRSRGTQGVRDIDDVHARRDLARGRGLLAGARGIRAEPYRRNTAGAGVPPGTPRPSGTRARAGADTAVPATEMSMAGTASDRSPRVGGLSRE
ncbi:glycosyltransferase [Sanguibacter sp. A247]